MYVFFTADPGFATSSLALGGDFLTDLMPYFQPILIVGLVILVIVALMKIIKH